MRQLPESSYDALARLLRAGRQQRAAWQVRLNKQGGQSWLW